MAVNPAVAGMPDSRQVTNTPVTGNITTGKITTDKITTDKITTDKITTAKHTTDKHTTDKSTADKNITNNRTLMDPRMVSATTQTAIQSFLTQLTNTVPPTEQITVATLWPVIATRINMVGPTDVSRRIDTPSSQLPPTWQTPAPAHARQSPSPSNPNTTITSVAEAMERLLDLEEYYFGPRHRKPATTCTI
ncbi:hypothetical protein CONLIGDRAFT_687736 [Coniochaeta ligniaria NRRL 30616]|uniref:Uncharacterized protein n=1 Tax=Coniochaeta ligniaria NRRL 30616 TaxID=1408157 RepID=A0A1J7I3N4_9PEZI|nr:hypothetical protein CONLIGDRAFT_687736 [Coniochaeta ligniaria NRRL 30616]